VNDPCAPPTCRLDGAGADAKLRCMPTPVDCTDPDPCTADRCEPTTGMCFHERPLDADGDGHLGQAPLDVPPSCGGADCDDADPSVFPGAAETCDGRDNDCDDGIDEDLVYTNIEVAPHPIAPPERTRAGRGGLVWNGEAYGLTYNTTSGHRQSFFKLLTPAGFDASAEVEVSHINADAFAGLVEWSGQSFFTAFSDARQSGNYEVYAARFRADGLKIENSEIRVTDAPDFSLNPAVIWTGDEYVVAWDDRRGRFDGGFPQIYARRYSVTGEPIGSEVLISPRGEPGESPALAIGERTIGFAYVTLDSQGVTHARFRALDFSLAEAAPAVEMPISSLANAPSVTFAGGRFLVAWSFADMSGLPGAAIHVAAVEESTNAVFGGHPVTFGFSFARAPSLVSLGDRAVVLFSGAGPDGAYDLHAVVVPATLGAVAAATRLTMSPEQSLFAYGARGPDGSIGIVFDEHDETPPETSRRPYFMSVGCHAVVTP
jgi:hypothetical protein